MNQKTNGSAFYRAIDALPKPKQGAKIPASKTYLIQPIHFAEAWESKPVDGILLGIRVPSEKDVQGARTEAAKIARRVPVEDDATDEEINEIRVQAFNDALMHMAVSSALCDPNDVSSPHPFFDMPDDMVPLALKSKTIQYIFDMIETLHTEQSPIFQEITDVEEIRLIELLSADDPYNGVDRVTAMKARRFLRYALDMLEG